MREKWPNYRPNGYLLAILQLETGAVDELYPLERILWLTWQGVWKVAHVAQSITSKPVQIIWKK